MECKIACLERVYERDPVQVTNGKHEPKTVGRDVHGGEDGRLVVKSVDNVEELESAHEQDADRWPAAAARCLLAGHAYVNQSPENKTWAQLVEGLDVERADAWVELASDVPLSRDDDQPRSPKRGKRDTHVVKEVTRVAAEREERARLERGPVDVERL